MVEVLQTARHPLGVSEVAQRVGLHPNAVRFHLEALVRYGLAEQVNEERALTGRPRNLYSATAVGASAARRSYRLLTEILTSYVAAQVTQPRQAALTAGEAWGRFLTDRPAPFRRIDAAAAATRQLVDALDDIGFAPEQ